MLLITFKKDGLMDISKPPDANDLAAASGVWKWLLFFGGLIGVGGMIEHWLSNRYATKKDLENSEKDIKAFQITCRENIMQQMELALLKNNERLEEKMIAAVSAAASTAMAEALREHSKQQRG